MQANQTEQNQALQAKDRAITWPEVRAIINICRSWVNHSIKNGDFPAPVKLGSRSLWSELQVRQWFANRLANPPKMGRPTRKVSASTKRQTSAQAK